MARIIVTADRGARDSVAVLLDETVQPVHLSSDHAATQLIERLAWALADGEQIERSSSTRTARGGVTPPRSGASGRGSRPDHQRSPEPEAPAASRASGSET